MLELVPHLVIKSVSNKIVFNKKYLQKTKQKYSTEQWDLSFHKVFEILDKNLLSLDKWSQYQFNASKNHFYYFNIQMYQFILTLQNI